MATNLRKKLMPSAATNTRSEQSTKRRIYGTAAPARSSQVDQTRIFLVRV